MKVIIALSLCTLVIQPVFSQSDSANIYLKKGMEAKDAKHTLVASQYFDKAIGFNPVLIEAYVQNAYANLEMRKTDAAKANLTALYKLDPTNQFAIRELTNLYFDYRQFPQALEFAKKCKGCENADRVIAMSSYELEDYTTAVKSFSKVLAKDPADAEATYTLGRTYLDMEQYKGALPYFNKAVQLDGTKSVWAYELGLLYYNQEDYKNAAVFFNKAAQAGYTQGTDFNENLGYAYIYSGQFEQGEKLLLNILSKKPGNKDILRDIAEAYYAQKMYDKALNFCQQLIEKDDKDAKALYQAGLCFQKKGEKNKGQDMCDKAIEMDPSLASKRQKNSSFGL